MITIILFSLLGWLLIGFLSAYLAFLLDDEDYTADMVFKMTLCGPFMSFLLLCDGSPLRARMKKWFGGIKNWAENIVVFKKYPKIR